LLTDSSGTNSAELPTGNYYWSSSIPTGYGILVPHATFDNIAVENSQTSTIFLPLVGGGSGSGSGSGSGTGSSQSNGVGSGSGSGSGSGTGSGTGSGSGTASASISGRSWADDNGNGIQDNDEGGVVGLAVNLRSNGLLMATQPSGPNGSYLFGGLSSGTYQIEFDFEGSAHFVAVNAGPDDVDSDVTGPSGFTDLIIVGSEQHRENVDAGLQWPTIVGFSTSWDGTEGGEPAGAVLYRTDTSGSLSVPYSIYFGALNDPNATLFASGTALFEAGNPNANVSFAVVNDSAYQGSRLFSVRLTAGGSQYALASASGQEVFVHDDELAPATWIEYAQGGEWGEDGAFVLKRTDTSGSLTVDYEIDAENTTAVEGTDYLQLPGSVVFAPGSATANVVFHTVAEGHAGEEKTLAIELTAALGDGPPPEVKPKGPAAKLGAKNDAPVFEKKEYEFTAAMGLSAPGKIGTVKATDPNGDPIKYAITKVTLGPLNIEAEAIRSWFAIDDKGVITAAKSFPRSSEEMTVHVKATDVPGGLFDTATVKVVLKPAVVLTGDFTAVKGSTDKIRLVFYRVSDQTLGEMKVKYEVTWTDQVKNALKNPEALNLTGNKGEITIAANKVDAVVELEAKPGNQPTGETLTFNIKVVVDATAAYMVVEEPIDTTIEYEGKRVANKGISSANLMILDKITLFGGYNSSADDDDGNSEVHLNDIRQQAFPNCWFMASVATVVSNSPDTIKGMMEEIDGGTNVRVKFYEKLPGGLAREKFVTVPLSLDLGFFQAGFSNDQKRTDRANPATFQGWEVWPQILEKAFAKMVGGEVFFERGSTTDRAMEILTGKSFEKIELADKTAAQIVTLVRDALRAGKRVTAETLPLDGTGFYWNIGIQKLYKTHAYFVKELTNSETKALFFNPWGYEHCNVPLADLKTYVQRLSIEQ